MRAIIVPTVEQSTALLDALRVASAKPAIETGRRKEEEEDEDEEEDEEDDEAWKVHASEARLRFD
jgi:hypothetical protein